MDQELKFFYDRELQHLEEMAAAFAKDERFATIAERLGLSQDAFVRDPFVDWLLQGTAFLTARLQLKLEQGFPAFTQNLLNVTFPHLLKPTPSMAVVHFDVDLASSALPEGPVVDRGISVRAKVTGSGKTEATFTTARHLKLWPLSVKGASYLPDPPALTALQIEPQGKDQSGLLLELEVSGLDKLSDLPLDSLDLYIDGAESVAMPLFSALTLSRARAAVLSNAENNKRPTLTPIEVHPLGFESETGGDTPSRDMLIPYDERSLDAYRLLQEFFALPQRFLFIQLRGLRRAFQAIDGRTARILFTFDQGFEDLVGRVTGDNVKLHCVPAINLFPKQMDDIRLDATQAEYPVLADRSRPADFEVHTIETVKAFDKREEPVQFRPFFDYGGFGIHDAGERRFYALSRRPRAMPSTVEGDMRLKDYRGSETFISFIDRDAVPFDPGLRRISLDGLCTNRHLPLWVTSGASLTCEKDFKTKQIKIIAGPSRPAGIQFEGRRLWDMVSHLSLNYLSLVDTPGGDAVKALRQLLGIYATDDVATRNLLDSIKAIRTQPIAGRPPSPQQSKAVLPLTFARGLEIQLAMDQSQLRAPLLAAILERFFAGYASVNSFTQTALFHGEDELAHRWPKRSGTTEIM